MQSAAKYFFASPQFAVAGASSNTKKFGHTIFAWYLSHDLPTTPVNPSNSSVTVRGKEYETTSSPAQLARPQDYSLSIITPPAVTAKLLEEAKESGIRAVWLQPGSFTDNELEYALREFPGAAVGGSEEGNPHGWCVLVHGEAAMEAAGRHEKL